MAWMVFSSLSPSGMLHYQSTNNHAGGLVACTVVSVLQSLVVFLLYLVPGKIKSVWRNKIPSLWKPMGSLTICKLFWSKNTLSAARNPES